MGVSGYITHKKSLYFIIFSHFQALDIWHCFNILLFLLPRTALLWSLRLLYRVNNRGDDRNQVFPPKALLKNKIVQSWVVMGLTSCMVEMDLPLCD